MKKISLWNCFLFITVAAGAQNTFPSTGNVGIGINVSPGTNLHVKSTAATPRISVQSTNASGTPGYSLGNVNSLFIWTMRYNIASNYLGFLLEGSPERFVITNDGNIGIGTTNPKTSLDIKEELRLGAISELPAEGSIGEGAYGNYILGSNNTQKLRFGVSNDGYSKAELFIDNSNRTDGTFSFKTSVGLTPSVTRMFINGDGNVSIGTTDAKGYRFAVNGDAMFTKINVKTFSTWPDYVFDPNYSLRPLSELEKYIKLNKHLPEIPTAEDIETNGIDLASGQAVLVKKIEELTLYIIEQNKRLEKQEIIIGELLNKIIK